VLTSCSFTQLLSYDVKYLTVFARFAHAEC
jgi:hypothetical protein